MPPAITITIEVEGAPLVVCTAETDQEALALTRWLDEHPRWQRLVEQAVELAEEARAA